jgi:methionyl-tRNA formyltransferase
MKLILMGTGPFAVPSFEALRADGHEILAVVTRPERVASGKGPPPSPVRLWSEQHKLARSSPDSINTPESVAWLADLQADLMVVCDYGQILSQECLSTTRLGGINLHGSLLPRHRGAAPVQWSILSGDRMAGVSVIHMTPGLDAGPVIASDHLEMEHDNALQLESRLSQLGVQTVRRSVALLQETSSDGSPLGVFQDPAKATRAPRLTKADGQLRCDVPVRFIDRQIRGLCPWPGCYAEIGLPNGKSVRTIFHSGYPVVGLTSGLDPGQILLGETISSRLGEHSRGQFEMAIVMPDGFYVVEILQPAGKNKMQAADFARGYARLEGLRILSPTNSSASSTLLDRMKKLEEPAT